jgi:hypothetical protein
MRRSARRWMRLLDHTMIFLLIAGTFTHFGLLALSGALAVTVLAVVWGRALVGIWLQRLWIDAPKWLSAAVYVASGRDRSESRRAGALLPPARAAALTTAVASDSVAQDVTIYTIESPSSSACSSEARTRCSSGTQEYTPCRRRAPADQQARMAEYVPWFREARRVDDSGVIRRHDDLMRH